MRERRNQLRHPHYAAPELLARRPNELWSWDITKLLGPAKWTYFYLYVILDVFSRYVVGWMVAHRESATLAERFIQETYGRQGIDRGQLTIHADRGPAMTSKPVALLLADLGVTKTHGRPHVSNDNPFSEAQFKPLSFTQTSRRNRFAGPLLVSAPPCRGRSPVPPDSSHEARGRRVSYATANSGQAPGIPLSSCVPRSSNRIPDPATRSRTVWETSTSPGPAIAATRAPMCTAMPPIFSPITSHSPVWSPARTVMPNERTALTIAEAHRIARAGPSKLAKSPSPAVSISRPRPRSTSRRARV